MITKPAFIREWLFNPRLEILSGIVVALALIPEAIGFSVVAGVDPKVGLYASVVIACVIAFTGGRPATISAATASTAVLMTSLVRDHGVQYLFAATILMGVFQIIAGLLKLGRLMRFVSQSVLTGFVRELSSNKPPPAPSSSRISLAWLERHRQLRARGRSAPLLRRGGEARAWG
jgi:sulfate permease, SulP family